MPETIEIIHRQTEHSLAVESRASMFGIPRAMGKAFTLIMTLMAKEDVKTESPPYTLYRNVNWDDADKSKGFVGFINMLLRQWDMQIGIPVVTRVEGEGSVIAATIPAGRYLRTLHRGPYKDLGKTYARIQAYAREQGLELANFMLEFYLNDPHEVSKEALETEVLIPLQGSVPD